MDLKTALPLILDYYDREVSQMICQKYGYSAMDAYKKFMFSKTYEMLCNPELQMWDFSCFGILTCGNPNKGREIPAIPFTSKGADN